MFDNQKERVIPVDHPFGVDDPNEPPARRRGRVLAGALGGLAIGLLLAAGAQQNAPGPEARSSTLPEVVTPPPTVSTTTTPTTIPPARLDVLVDGYSGTLFLAGAVNQQPKLWRWDSRTGTPLELEVPNRMASASFNSSRVRVAVPTFSTVMPGFVLWIGLPGNVEPVAVDVADFAWHESDPARIAWVDRIDDELVQIHTATLPAGVGSTVQIEGELASLLPQPGFLGGAEILTSSLVEFGDDGFLIEAITNEDGYLLIALDPGGEETGRLNARYIGRLPDGDLLVSQNSALVRASREGLTPGEEVVLPTEKRVAALARAGTNDFWATWEIEETTGISEPARLFVLDGDEIAFETTLPSALRAVSWSQDGRWLVVAIGEPSNLSGFTSGVLWFIDTEDWSMHQVDAPGLISAIAAVP